MPELPEVETVVRELREGSAKRGPSVVGKTIASVTVKWPRHIAMPSPRALKQLLPGRTVERLGRRGKYLVFELSAGARNAGSQGTGAEQAGPQGAGGALLIHLKMSGDLTVVAVASAAPDRHAHTVFHFTDGTALRFSDTRKFGKVFLVERAEDVTGGLGPEPLEPGFTAARLGRMLAERKRLLKPLLLDQTFIAGLGNIYTDEALNLARLHPMRRSDTLTSAEVRALWRGIRQALRSGIRHDGASIDWVYRGGGMQHHFRVYDRAGQPCPACGTPVRRIVVGQRGTHFCPRCQKLR
jgi:formamidopyrimidine-DNA glycosylase